MEPPLRRHVAANHWPAHPSVNASRRTHAREGASRATRHARVGGHTNRGLASGADVRTHAGRTRAADPVGLVASSGWLALGWLSVPPG
jgi:hypothetical protein